MPTTTQKLNAFALTTPLHPDTFLVERVHGSEALSELFRFELDLLAAAEDDVPFDRVLGQPAGLEIRSAEGEARTVHGIICRLSQGAELRGRHGGVTFVRYRAVLVPTLWRLTRRRGCRIFQQKSVPEILEEVFGDLEKRFRLSAQYERRDYCVQYRETDFAFASRLMEEEGICYFFDHSGGSDVLVIGDHPTAHPPVPGPTELTYDPARGGMLLSDRVTSWEKTQEVRSGRVTLWDHTFEVPHDHLEASAEIQSKVKVGKVEHKLTAGEAGELEVYDYPAAVAQRFDGVSPGGEPQGDLRQVFPDVERTVKIRMAEVAAGGLEVDGESTARHLTAGHTFALTRHFNADGRYLLTRITHTGREDGVYTGESSDTTYQCRFQCLPVRLPFRPQRVTTKPTIHGTQTAVVVGPAGEEIFTDKYGRVKVQFPWDREGKHDENSSCWVRVSQVHAGSGWGGIDIPRAGEEVVVAFEEGDPDRPIVIGRVYNAREMPPFDLPGKAMVSGLKSNTYPGGGGSNEISMDDSKGSERMYIHAQYNQDEVIEHDQTSHVKNNRTRTVDVDETVTVGNNRTATVKANETATVNKNHTHKVGKNHTEKVGKHMKLSVGRTKTETVGLTSTETVAAAKATTVGGAYALTVGGAMATTVGLMSIENVGLTKTVTVGDKLELVCGSASIVLESSGKITLKGTTIVIDGGNLVDVDAALIDLN
jgi:type VI secretion system secreted protein VgrG